jgi:hypothetical protein
MLCEIKDYKVNELPLRGKPNSRYYVPNGNGTDIDEYVTDVHGNYHKVNPIQSSTDVEWGTIIGTLSDQTDLQAALDDKVDESRTLTINGLAQDLSADRTWNVGTVTSFSAGDLSPLFTTSEATATTTPALTFAQVSQNQNLVFASPDGSSGNPVFRALVLADLPAIAAPTFQEVLTAGSTLDQDNVIDVDGFDFTWNDVSAFNVNALGSGINLSGNSGSTLLKLESVVTLTGVGFTNLAGQDRLVGWQSSNGQLGNITIGTGLSLSGGQLTGTVSAYTDEQAQDAVGGMVDTTLVYTDLTPLLQRAALTGAITAAVGSNTTALGSFTKAQLDTAVSDGNVLYVGDITQYTDEMAQDAVGNILLDSSEIDFDYNDGIPSITASLIAGSIANSKLANSSIGFALGTSGTDINWSSSPVSLGSTATLNVPDASVTARGVVTTGSQSFAGDKTFTGNVNIPTSGTQLSMFNGVFGDNSNVNPITWGSNYNHPALILNDFGPSAMITWGLKVGKMIFAMPSNIAFCVNEAGNFASAVGSNERFLVDVPNTKINLNYATAITSSGTSFTPTGTLDVDGTTVIRSLDTGAVAPVTTGTTKMVISDSNGLLSFDDIPTGGVTIGQATLDFGVVPDTNTRVIIADTAITGTSKIIVSLSAEDTPDHSIDEVLASGVFVAGGEVVAGVGFTIYGYTHSPTMGEYVVNYTIEY